MINVLKKTAFFLLCFNQLAFSAKTLYSITPMTSPVVDVPLYFQSFVEYNVINQTKKTQTLQVQPQLGVTQSSNPGFCLNPFTLTPNASCILQLRINGDEITTSGTIGGPKVCNSSSSFFCSQPDSANQLSVNLVYYSSILLANSGTGGNGYLSFCLIGSGGELEQCQNFLNGVLGEASGVAITRTGYVYSADQSDDSLSICFSARNPQTATCQSFNGGGGIFDSPRTTYLNNGYLYSLNYNSNSVVQCTVDINTGTLSNCAATGSGFSGPLGSMVISNGYAYIPNSTSNNVSICAVNPSDGTLSNCSNFADSSFSSPSGVTLLNGFAYIVSVWTEGIVACKVNPTNGTLSNCITNNVLTNSLPSGINTIGGYLYVNASSPSQINKCLIGDNGLVSTCTNTGSNFDMPTGNIAFVTQ